MNQLHISTKIFSGTGLSTKRLHNSLLKNIDINYKIAYRYAIGSKVKNEFQVTLKLNPFQKHIQNYYY